MSAGARWVHYFSDPLPSGSTDLKLLLGGKGASLKELTRAGLAVPPGFTITPECCAHYFAHAGAWPEGLEAELRANLRRLEQETGRTLGRGEQPLLVSVRSGAAVSMPGMMDTVLNVGLASDPWQQLADCINAVFASWQSGRAVAYRQRHNIEGLAGTACTVQAMFPSEVSGVLFTHDPLQQESDDLVIEAVLGLGERVVSGAVTPDRYIVRRSDLACINRQIKAAACLTDPQIVELARLGLRVEAHYGHPVDLEWGLADGRFALLQARPIRHRVADAARVRSADAGRVADEFTRLKQLAKSGRKLWVLHNLAETLPAPTPLTWNVVRRFMRGDGGFGRLYQSLGYRPSRRVRVEGFLELIGGRTYADPDRLAEFFWDGLPLAYDLDALAADPSLLDRAPPGFDPDRATSRFLTMLPANLWGMWRAARSSKHAASNARRRFESLLPRWNEYIRREREVELEALSDAALIELLQDRISRVLDQFGPESLRPGFFGGLAFDRLRSTLARFLGKVEGHALADALTRGAEQDTTVEQDLLLEQVAEGRAPLDHFLERYGHRAAGEMELAQPRWREEPLALEPLIEHLRRAGSETAHNRHAQNHARRLEAEASLPERLRAAGCSSLREQVEADRSLACELLPYRETGKHYLMLGYELLRHATEGLAHRWGLGRDLYFLNLDELPRFPRERTELVEIIAARREHWQSLQEVPWPAIIDSRLLDRPGNVAPLAFVRELTGQPMASGIATGEAAIVYDPHKLPALPADYVLVCPSTDPGWTPLFLNARGLVVERGGVLSHGAIVARDFGIPAVACPGAMQLLRAGDTLRIDGHTGRVQVLKRGGA
jgi:pyruvate,water dikinase